MLWLTIPAITAILIYSHRKLDHEFVSSALSILRVLSVGELMGFEIEGRLGQPRISVGRLCAILGRLEDLDIVSGEWHVDERERWRRFNRLTAKGRRVVEHQ